MALSGMSFDPARPPRSSGPTVDYGLARRSVLSAVRRGTMATSDVCDAHPELIRAAKNIGHVRDDLCPICSHETIRWVQYVYGDELKRNSGRVVYPEEWLAELVKSHDEFTCYIVEVCLDCSWNHLIRSYMAGRRFRSGRGKAKRQERG